MSLKRALAAVALAASVAGLAALAFTLGPLAPVTVSVAPASAEDLPLSVFGVGTVEARYAYSVGPTQTGRVAAVRADHGDRVRAGQVLAEMDPVDLPTFRRLYRIRDGRAAEERGEGRPLH